MRDPKKAGPLADRRVRGSLDPVLLATIRNFADYSVIKFSYYHGRRQRGAGGVALLDFYTWYFSVFFCYFSVFFAILLFFAF